MSVLKTQFAARSAKRLRTNMTDAERALWYQLRDRRLSGHKFVRQQPVGPYIADFACRDMNLIVEVDGGQHAENQNDIKRTSALEQHGYSILRFWNNDVLNNIDGVLIAIATHLEKAPSPDLRRAKADLSPKGKGEEGELYQ